MLFQKYYLTLQHGKVYQSFYRHRVQVLKNMDTLNRLPWAAQNAVFQRLEEIAEVSAMTKDERIKYDHALKVYRDTLNAYNGALQDGLQQGLEQGREQGRAEGLEQGLEQGELNKALDIARSLKSMGLSLTDIEKATGLTEEQIKEL